MTAVVVGGDGGEIRRERPAYGIHHAKAIAADTEGAAGLVVEDGESAKHKYRYYLPSPTTGKMNRVGAVPFAVAIEKLRRAAQEGRKAG